MLPFSQLLFTFLIVGFELLPRSTLSLSIAYLLQILDSQLCRNTPLQITHELQNGGGNTI